MIRLIEGTAVFALALLAFWLLSGGPLFWLVTHIILNRIGL